MKILVEDLIRNLNNETTQFIQEAQRLKKLPIESLNKKINSTSWSALECLEHLNLYGDFYIPEFEKSIEKAVKNSTIYFKSGWFGNYSANSMLPKENLNKMKTFKDKDPNGSELNINTIDRFIDQQNKMLDLLEKSRSIDLSKTKCNTTLPVIRFKLGDTLRFVINHNIRHMIQAKKAIL